MGASKIKGHRIDDKALGTNHINDAFKLSESDHRVLLQYPTHDNAGDLTVPQKNTLTQMGNADSLHYHVGGGGGAQGIYTDQQRDVELLKLSMLFSATKYGMDQSVRDVISDDNSVYYGIHAAQSPTLRNITNDGSIGGLLLQNTTYTYGLAYKTVYGETDVINTSMIQTVNGSTNAVELTFSGVPTENNGVKVFRSIGQVPKVIVENETANEWSNPFNLPIDVNGTDKTSGLDCIKISTKGFVNNLGQVVYNAANIAYGVGKRVLNDGQQLGVQVAVSAPFDYLIQINNKATVNRLDLIWDSNPANIPIDYEIYYAVDPIPTNVNNINWFSFNRLQKVCNMWNTPLSVSTDGAITSGYKVTGNTRSTNSFNFAAINNVTAIRVKVITLMSRCMLNDVRLFTEQNSTNQLVTKDWATPNDFSIYKTLVVDMKSNAAHYQNLKMGFIKGTEVISTPTVEMTTTPNTTMLLTGYSCRQTFNPTNNTAVINHSGNDRIRLTFTPDPNQYLRMENIFIMMSSKVHDHTTTAPFPQADADCQTLIIPVTFNNGLPYYDGTPAGQIVSDWIYFPYPPTGVNWQNYVVSWKIVSGSLRYQLSWEYSNFFRSLTTGYENCLTWNGYVPIDTSVQLYNYNFVTKVEYGKSNAQYMDMDYFDPSVCEKWHRHYIPMPLAAGSQDVKRLAMLFNNITIDQDVFVDNIYVTRAFDTVSNAGATLKCSVGGINPTNMKINDSTYYLSDLTPTNASPKTILLDYGATITNVNRINILFGSKANAPKSWAVQWSIDSTAIADDAVDSPKWSPVSSLILGESGIVSEFTGSVVNNAVFNNNIWAGHLLHSFTPVGCTKIRILFYGTIGDLPVRVMNMRVMSADDLGTMNLVYERNTNVIDGWKWTDDGKPTQQILPSLFNTTGSYNVIFDSSLQLIKLIDKTKNGIIHFNELTFPLYIHLIATAQIIGTVEWWVSNDHGLTYQLITLDTLFSFATQATSLRIKAVLKSPDAVVSAFALLFGL